MTSLGGVAIFIALIALVIGRRIYTGRRIDAYRTRGAVVVDVRSPAEFRGAHAEGAINVPLDQLASLTGSLDKSRPILLCCASGARSAMAARMLRAKGFDTMNAGSWTRLNQRS